MRAVEPLIAALHEEETGLEAVKALGTIGDVRAIKPLQEALKASKSGAYKCSAALVLLQLDDATGLESLLESLGSGRPALEVLEAILDYGRKHRAEYVSVLAGLLKSSKHAGVRRYAAEFLIQINEASVKPLLAPVLLDWLEFSAPRQTETDEGVKLIANAAGLDAELLELAASALGHRVQTKFGRLPGDNVPSDVLVSYDAGMNAIIKLCQRRDAWSSRILLRVSKKKDILVSLSRCDRACEQKLSLEKEREAARQELMRRGCADSDSIAPLQE